MPVFDNTFYDIAILLGLSAAVGALMLRLRQPLIMAFILVGLLLGPSGFGQVHARDQVELLANIGITLLLFVVGLKLDLNVIRTVGPVALATGLGQVVFTSGIGYVLARALGMTTLTALYVAVALTFSSTIIIVKLLSDKKEIDALHGRIAVGFLIVQDILVVLAMIGLTALGQTTTPSYLPIEMLLVLAKGGAMLAGLALLMRYALPDLLRRLASSPELLVLFAIAWTVALASVGDALGFSQEVGAFLAGVSLASTPYRDAIGSRLISLRDFLLLFFFIDLGAQLDLGLLGGQIVEAIVLSLFVLVGNPIIVMIIMGYMGYRKRTSFLAGLAVAQISEFSLILGALGVKLGHIETMAMGIITLVGLVTIGLSTYMILYSHALYRVVSPWLDMFERRVPHREELLGDVSAEDATQAHIIVFGLGRYGGNIARELQCRDMSVVGVDFDPEVIRAWQQEGLLAIYGDAEDPEFPASLPLRRARWVVSAIPQRDTNLVLLHALQQHGYAGKIAATAHRAADAESLRHVGVALVLQPFSDAAKEAATVLAA